MNESPYWQVVLVCYDDEVYGKLDSMRLYTGLLMLFGFLLISFITHRTTVNLMRLQQADMEKERIEGELRIAHQIQQSMLPMKYTPDADFPKLDICGSLVPAREVGGDLFDFFIRDKKLFFCIGDVSGKGVPSAIIMAQAHSLFRVTTMKNSNPAHVMQMLNALLCQNNESNMFVTFFIGILDLPTGQLRYCDAGHDRPVLVGKGLMEANPHLPLGVFADTKYDQEEIKLESGTTLFLYTDGLTEAKNAAHQQFGLERVLEALTQHASCEALLNNMTETVHRFVLDAEQSDDLTMLAIRYQL
jgi:sigma-B regulation protein RsbU (phosphoserine phosphatase)